MDFLQDISQQMSKSIAEKQEHTLSLVMSALNVTEEDMLKRFPPMRLYYGVNQTKSVYYDNGTTNGELVLQFSEFNFQHDFENGKIGAKIDVWICDRVKAILNK